ncbi:MAG: nitroreductase family protein, partial [candidate division WOR-3 bacterium]
TLAGGWLESSCAAGYALAQVRSVGRHSMTNGAGGFLKLCLHRRSVRRFRNLPVDREKLMRCLEAARLAPSAENRQPWRFVVFDDPAEKERLARAVFRGVYAVSARFADAPVLVCLLIREDVLVNRLAKVSQGVPYQFVDAGIAGEHFVLAAAEQGIGTCWIGWFDTRALVRHLKLQGRGFRPIALIAVGYPAEDAGGAVPKRRALADTVFWNRPPDR